MVDVCISAHVSISGVLLWLHEHVGVQVGSPFVKQGHGWRILTDVSWQDLTHPGSSLNAQHHVQFDDHVHPDLITQFALTFG